MSAFASLGRHDPPYPSPAFRNWGLIRWSRPMPFATVVMSASGIFSHMLAMVLMKLIFVARKALLAYLMSSAVGRFVLIVGGVLSP